MTLSFVINGEAVGQGRPRFYHRGNFIGAYDPPKSKAYKNAVKLAAKAAIADSGMENFFPTNEPVSVEVLVYKSVPKSWSRNKRLAAITGEIAAVTKPDIDNIFKCVTDAMNGIVYTDDAHIVRSKCDKAYALVPCVVVNVGIR